MRAGEPQLREPGNIVRHVLSGVRQYYDVAAVGGDPGQCLDRAGIGRHAVMQDPVLVDEKEIELIRDVAQAVDPLHEDGPLPSALSARRATPMAAASFAAPPPTVTTRMTAGPPSSARR